MRLCISRPLDPRFPDNARCIFPTCLFAILFFPPLLKLTTVFFYVSLCVPVPLSQARTAVRLELAADFSAEKLATTLAAVDRGTVAPSHALVYWCGRMIISLFSLLLPHQ